MKKNKLAIILTNYNDSRFIIPNLKKIVEQKPEEIVFVDDYSTDGSYDLVKYLYPSIKLYKSDRKKGTFYAFIQALENTECEFGTVIGLDDEILPEYITKAQEAISKYPFVDLITINSEIEREGEKYTKMLFKNTSYVSPQYLYKIVKKGLGHHINLAGSCFRVSEVMKLCKSECGKMNANLDATFSFYLAFNKGFVHLGEKLTLFRSYPNSWGSSGKLKDIEESNAIQDKYYKENLSPENYKLTVDCGISNNHIHGMIYFCLRTIMLLPKFIRKYIYKKFYGYDWRIEKL